MTTFDLITQPWIPVVNARGQTELMGLRDVLIRAHEFRALRDPLPTVEFGLHRLLVAVIQDIFHITDAAKLRALLDAGAFDPAAIDDYFTRWHDRFDLFHPQHPFLQTPGMNTEPAKPLAGLLHPLPSGTNAQHFHHDHEDNFGVSPAAAAGLLTTIAPFMTAGGAGLSPSINGAPPFYILILGNSLFETLCLNTYAGDLSLARGNQTPPAWRDDRLLAPQERSKGEKLQRSTGASLLESLTWRPRRIQLIPGEGGCCSLTGRDAPILVRTMKFAAGASCDFSWRDPAAAYALDDKDGARVLRPREARPIWRDTGPLALLNKDDAHASDKARYERPFLMNQFEDLVAYRVVEKQDGLTLTVYGLRTDMKMKIFEWQRERLSLPVPLVLQRTFHRVAQEEINTAGEVARALYVSIKMAYPREGKGSDKAFASLIADAERAFWHALHSEYQTLLNNLGQLDPEQEAGIAQARAAWRQAIRCQATLAFQDAVGPLDADAQALQRQALAEKKFRGMVLSALMTPEEKAAQAQRKKIDKTTKKG